jgi:MFS family permease
MNLYSTLTNPQGLGSALGGPVGGWAADQFGWRVAFSAQIPFLIASMVAIVIYVPGHLGKHADEPSGTRLGGSPAAQPELTWLAKLKRIDYLGSFLLAISVASLLLGFSLKTAARKADGSEYAWRDPAIVGLLICFGTTALAFLAVEEWYAVEPVLPLALLGRRTPACVAISNLTMAMAVFSLMYNLPLFFTAVRLQSASMAGLHLLPFSILIGCGSLVVGTVMARTGRYYPAMVVSALVVLASMGMILTWTPHSPEWMTWVAQSPAGFGYAGVLTSTLVGLMAEVQKAGRGEIAVATSMTYMARTIGQVLGVALSSALLQATLQADLAAALPLDPQLVDEIRRSTTIIPTLPPAIREIAVGAYAHGLQRAAWFNFCLAGVTVLTLAGVRNEAMPHAAESERERNDEA